jgi:hypothetical protein
MGTPPRARARAHRPTVGGLIASLAAIALTGCLGTYSGVGPISTYHGTACPTVLVIGDSLADPVAQLLTGSYAASGRCARVVDRAVGGSSATNWAPGGIFDVRNVLDSVQPNIVVAHFIGNSGWGEPLWDPSGYWLSANENALLQIVGQAVSRGEHIYVATPPRAAVGCWWGTGTDGLWTSFHHWIRDTLPALQPAVRPLDWRTPFGGDTYYSAFQFPDGSIHQLRADDCVHFTPDGASVAAGATVAATQGEWGVGAAVQAPQPTPVGATPTTTSGTTPTSTPTTSTPTTSTPPSR